MQEKAKEPEIRFAGFTGAWEQRKAKDVLAAYSDKGHPGLDVLSATQDRGMVRRDDNNINISHDKKNEATYKRVLPGQFVIHLRSFQGGFAYSSIEGITSPAYTVFGFSKPQEHEPNFWKFVFSSEQFIKRLEKVTYGIRDGRSISYDEVLTLSFTFPGKEEQIQIAHFLDKVGALITLHQRKYEKLLNIKKSMLEKMFPKEGEVVPEIRFKGFTGAWEQRKLGDIADITGGGTPSTSNNDYWDGNINWYSPAEISNQIFLNSSQRKITELGFSSCSAKMLPKGTVLFTSRAGIGKTAILSAEGCTNQGFQSIVPHANDLDSYFIFSRTNELKKYGEIVGAGSTFVEVSGKQMAAMTLMMPPKFNEQKTIGDFFKRLDSLLTLHQRKLEMLKNVKQAFLEKMFV